MSAAKGRRLFPNNCTNKYVLSANDCNDFTPIMRPGKKYHAINYGNYENSITVCITQEIIDQGLDK